MQKIKVSADLSLPIKMASQAVVIVGIRGSGKTSTAVVMAEELLQLNYPLVIVDPTDAWWGLRSRFPVFIFGGSHGDLPLDATDGKVIAEFIVQERLPLILSIRHLRKNDQRRFVTELFEELYHLKGSDQYRTPLTVVLDEAPLFVPQNVQGDVARTVGAVEDLIARGRNAGFGVVLISQRFATINKNVSTQADTIIAHRLPSPQDRKALSEWVEENATIEQQKEVLASLARLKTGQAWFWCPSLDVIRCVQVRMRESFDSSASPQPGQRIAPLKKLTEVDLNVLKGRLATTIEKARQDDPKTLKARIAELEKQLKTRVTVEPVIKQVEVPIISERDREDLFNALARTSEAIVTLTEAVRQAPKNASTPPKVIPKLLPRPPIIVSDSKRGSAHQRILDSLAWWEAVGVQRVDRGCLAIMANYTVCGHFNNLVAQLRSQGMIEYVDAQIEFTAAGRQAANHPEAPGDLSALHGAWRSKLSDSEWKVLSCVIASHPNALDKGDLAAMSGYTVCGHFNNMLSRFRSLGLISGRGVVEATELLFPRALTPSH